MPRNRENDDVDDEDDEELDADLDEQDDEEDDDLADLTEDELKAELRKTRDSLSKASGSSKKKRDRIKELERDLAAKGTAKPDAKKDGEKGDAPDADAIRQAVEAEVTTKANDRIKRAEARGALKAAGVPAAQVGDLVAMLKLDDISVGKDGEVDGDDLDEAIAALKAKWPQLFAPVKTTRKRERVAGDGDGSGDRAPRKKMTTSQLQAAAALGRVVR